jgi:hypothetical protein
MERNITFIGAAGKNSTTTINGKTPTNRVFKMPRGTTVYFNRGVLSYLDQRIVIEVDPTDWASKLSLGMSCTSACPGTIGLGGVVLVFEPNDNDL